MKESRQSRRRRGAGEGSIYKRKDSLWVGLVQLGADENGKRLRRYVYAATQGEVVEKIAELRQSGAPWVAPASLKLGEYLKHWLHNIAGPRVRPSTLDFYERVLAPAREQLGGVPLRALTPMQVQALLGRLEEAGVSARGRQMAFGALRTALRDAVRTRLIAVNPLDAVSRPRAPRPEIQALSAEQVKALLKAAEADPYEAVYAVAVGGGLRLGEILGLRWGDVDFDAGVVRVRRALVERVNGERTFAEPKTARGRRQVDLPAFAIGALRRHLARLGGAAPHPERLVFPSAEGLPMRRSNLKGRSYKPLLRRAKLPNVSFHALRHTAATLQLAAGVNPKVVQERLGHSTVQLTLDTYSHSVATLGKDAAARLDALVGAGSP
jgi:integrase